MIKKTLAIRPPRHANEILIERDVIPASGRWPVRQRKYSTLSKAAELKRAGWVVFYAAGTGWVQR